MQLSELLDLWLNDRQFSALIGQLNKNSGYRVEYYGIDGSAGSYFLAALSYCTGRPLLLITADQARAEKAYANLDAFLPGQVRLLPARELFVNPAVYARSEEIQHQRLRFLQCLTGGNAKGIYVAPVAALLGRMMPFAIWRELTISLSGGERLNREELVAALVERGYERSSLTETAGQFSARGDIVDIFSPGLGRPLRLELFDDNLEAIRFFDPLSQRSTELVQTALIIPARERVLSPERYLPGEKLIRKTLNLAIANLRRRGSVETAAKLRQQVGRHLEKLSHPEGLDLLNNYFPYFYGAGASLLDYLPEASLLAVEEISLVAQKEKSLSADLNQYVSDCYAEGSLLGSSLEQLWRLEALLSCYSGPLVGINALAGGANLIGANESLNIDVKSAPRYHDQWELFSGDLQQWRKERCRVCLAADTQEKVKALADWVQAHLGNGPELDRLCGAPEEGFIIPQLKLVVLTEHDLLPKRRKKRRIAEPEGTRYSNYRELTVGDYVVHEQHGIGQFHGTQTLEIAGIRRDYLLLRYRGTDKLYIPIDQVSIIRKYSGGDGPSPRLHSLGGAEWQRLKGRVSRSVEELAKELLQLYAARQAVSGYSYGPDHPWQQEFEAQFPFEETADQLQAIKEVKADLEKAHPMDRLICGDVGYGKTEVALRAAFKVVMEGKQVAIMVPTTVLAQQHYRTFRERFGSFPFQVAQLSRFVPPGRQKEITSSLAAGKIDIIIGTHRLLSKDLAFKDLGLLVIDEEHRFGVKQKEKMKKMRLEVDVLSMTATPIPRTLHFSLAGARDLSIVDSPPENRYPVQTYVLEYSDNLVQEAVQRELNRQGQVFIVFNRVEQIDAYAERVRKLLPSAAIAVGHGQMPESKLENIMADFQDGLYQVLISSTIIESGLDIPNVNTLVINEADRFGLAQLYQIRGRVGRSSRIAYAYLTYYKDKLVSEAARKRLKAIREFTDRGSGFKIALRDLEIRGAGNMLGVEQHGFIAAVGFDLYIKMLDQAVSALKNEKPAKKTETRLELQVSAYLPSAYIPAQDQKVDLYMKIYSAASVDGLAELEDETADRFGSVPEPGRLLFKVARLKIRAAEAGISLISETEGSILFHFTGSSAVNVDQLKAFPAVAERKMTISGKIPLQLKIDKPETTTALPDHLICIVEELLAYIAVGSDRDLLN